MNLLMKKLFQILFMFMILAASTAVEAAQLIMVEQGGCTWCAAWNKDIGGIYDKTPEGKIAPLRKIDLFKKRPADLTFIKAVVFTPTFVLIDDEIEIGRIIGYPGETFFWQQLNTLLKKLESNENLQSKKD